jgi:hypothetical protein
MKHTTLLTALAILTLTACNKKPAEQPFVPDPLPSSSASLPAGHPQVNTDNKSMPLSGAPQVEQMQQAIVVSTIDIPQFTYIEVSQNNETRWIATANIAVKKRDVIQFANGSTVVNFHSKALNRTFPSLTFVNHVTVINGK